MFPYLIERKLYYKSRAIFIALLILHVVTDAPVQKVQQIQFHSLTGYLFDT